jgi:rhodanese-related sulfurtransferase
VSYQDIEAAQVATLLKRENLVVLDTRDALSQSQGQLPKAQPASDQVISALMKQRRSNPPVLVYCYEGNTSRDMCSFLAQLGLSEIYNLAGGWKAWLAQGD